MVFTKWFIIVVAALFLILIIYSWGYSDGYDDGYDPNDYARGYFDGFNDGYGYVKRGDNNER